MSKLQNNHVFTSESVSEGHPDKVCDQVSDAILDACLAEDRSSKVACETALTTNYLINIGEITCRGWDNIDLEAIIFWPKDGWSTWDALPATPVL